MEPAQVQYLQEKDLLCSLIFQIAMKLHPGLRNKLPGPLVLYKLASFMVPRASILNVVLLSTVSYTGLNVWHKRVKRVLCSSLLPRGLNLHLLSFVSSILMTWFRQTFGNALLAQETHFLKEISFNTAK